MVILEALDLDEVGLGIVYLADIVIVTVGTAILAFFIESMTMLGLIALLWSIFAPAIIIVVLAFIEEVLTNRKRRRLHGKK